MNELEKIREWGLLPSTRREISLLTFSIIARSYVFLLQKEIGFSYRGIGAIGNREYFQSLINNQETEKEMSKVISSLNLEKVFERAQDLFTYSQLLRRRSISEEASEKAFNIIVHSYLNYLVSLGIYNCFWRYLGNSTKNKLLSEKEIKTISSQRDQVAAVYMEMEKELGLITENVGKKNNFNGKLLLSSTFNEIQEYLAKNKFDLPVNELGKRKKRYFYLCSKEEEKVITNSRTIDRINRELFSKKENVTSLKGATAHPGRVKGIVYNRLKNKKKMPEGAVLVTSMTHPNDVPLIGKCSAIVTDEGGILCHAAIIAREMNKPCIIGTKIGTKVLKEGSLVEVNATEGTVKLIKNGPHPRSIPQIISRKRIPLRNRNKL